MSSVLPSEDRLAIGRIITEESMRDIGANVKARGRARLAADQTLTR